MAQYRSARVHRVSLLTSEQIVAPVVDQISFEVISFMTRMLLLSPLPGFAAIDSASNVMWHDLNFKRSSHKCFVSQLCCHSLTRLTLPLRLTLSSSRAASSISSEFGASTATPVGLMAVPLPPAPVIPRARHWTVNPDGTWAATRPKLGPSPPLEPDALDEYFRVGGDKSSKHLQRPLDFAGGLDKRLSVPEVLLAYICDHLDTASLRALQHSSAGAMFFVQQRHRSLSKFRHPHHLGRLYTYADLNAYQRLELKLMRFYDRPLWQRVCIGVACVPILPFVLVWHSPKLLVFGYNKAVTPVLEVVERRVAAPAWKAFAWTVDRAVIRPARFTYRRAIVPSARFVLYRCIIPAFWGTLWLFDQFLDYVVHPIWDGVAYVVQATRKTLAPISGAASQQIRKVGRIASNFLTRLVRHIIQPAYERFIERIFWCVNQLFRWILIPLWRTLVWLWRRVIFPVLRVFWSIVRYVSEEIIWKVVASLGSGIRLVFYDVVFLSVLAPLLTALWLYILVPAGGLIQAAAAFIAGIFMMVAQAIGDAAAAIASLLRMR